MPVTLEGRASEFVKEIESGIRVEWKALADFIKKGGYENANIRYVL